MTTRPLLRPLLGLAIAGLFVIASSTTAMASGQRGRTLSSPKDVETFTKLKGVDLLKRRLNYVGSTAKWHLFFEVRTSTGGGRPYDHLFAFKVPVDELKALNGWKIAFSKRYIAARRCPSVSATKGKVPVIKLPKDPQARKRCGT